jgi:hypothetical protein
MYNLKRLKRIFQEVFVKNVALKKKKTIKDLKHY